MSWNSHEMWGLVFRPKIGCKSCQTFFLLFSAVLFDDHRYGKQQRFHCGHGRQGQEGQKGEEDAKSGFFHPRFHRSRWKRSQPRRNRDGGTLGWPRLMGRGFFSPPSDFRVTADCIKNHGHEKWAENLANQSPWILFRCNLFFFIGGGFTDFFLLRGVNIPNHLLNFSHTDFSALLASFNQNHEFLLPQMNECPDALVPNNVIFV